MPLPPLCDETDTASTTSAPLNAVAALLDGRVAREDTLASATPGRFDGGPADGLRFIDVSMSGGWSFRVLPDRGLDIGNASAFGVPIGWMSRVGDIAPLDGPDGMAWLERFTGGLLTTCGPDNIGLPCVDGTEHLGLHGSWSFLRAADVAIRRHRCGDDVVLTLSAAMAVTSGGQTLALERTISARTGSAVLQVDDTITNTGVDEAPIPMLYHVNFGAPFWSPPAAVYYPNGTETVPRTAHASAMQPHAGAAPEVLIDGEEYVYQRRVPSPETTGVVVENTSLGQRLVVTWDSSTLPISHQWVHPAAGNYALGIEPANAALPGRAALRAAGELPLIRAGEQQSFSVRIAASRT